LRNIFQLLIIIRKNKIIVQAVDSFIQEYNI
jgi:hypothetical protein